MSSEKPELTIERIKEIADSIPHEPCKQDYCCATIKTISELCKAVDFGLDNYLKCLEETPNCGMSFSFGSIYMCKCPVRNRIAREYET